MPNQSPFKTATAGHQQVPLDWMPATQVRPFVFEDPVVIWLKHHGEKHGFQPETSPYEFLDFIGEKGRQFEKKWTEEMAPDTVRVCDEAFQARSVEKMRETWELMLSGTAVIAQPALWWAPERVYGVPDLLVHTSWLRDNFPDLLSEVEGQAVAPNLRDAGMLGHYIVFDIKFTTKLDEPRKDKDLESYAAQVRIYSYILGHLQGLMRQKAYLITRDRISNPLPVDISSTLKCPLDDDLAAMRDKFMDIKLNGANFTPWQDDIVVSNIKQPAGRWRTAKNIIAQEKVPGRDSGLLYQISLSLKRELAAMGFPSLDSMLQEDPKKIPFEKSRGVGPAKANRIRAILEANRSGSPVAPPSDLIPPKKRFEFYVDFEYFTNVNVDFDSQWPTLDGCDMIFMVGAGWKDGEGWAFRTFAAAAEDQDQEREMLEEFLQFLRAQTEGVLTDATRTALYHWTSPEVWQARRASDRHQLPVSHPLRKLPWYDLQKVFLDGPCGVPGAWTYGLKQIAKALGKLNPEFDPQWPGDLDEGLRAMVMGWTAYQTGHPLESQEMTTLTQYLEADCKALWKILKWLRS